MAKPRKLPRPNFQTKKPTHLFRPMSAKEVEELWTKYFEKGEQARRMMESCLTSDKEGVKTLFMREFNESLYQSTYIDQARHILVDILARKKRKKR